MCVCVGGCSGVGVGGVGGATFVGAVQIKGLDEDSVSVCVCVAGGWVSLL